MYVIKRDGRQETVQFDKITARIMKLSYGLNSDFCDPVRAGACDAKSEEPALPRGPTAFVMLCRLLIVPTNATYMTSTTSLRYWWRKR